MAIPFLTSINLRGNETQNHVLHLTSSDPTTYVSAAGGNIYYNTGTDKIKYYDSTTWQTIASESWVTSNFLSSATAFVDGSGTTNYIPKWTPDGDTLGNSQIFDNGTDVGINTATPVETLDVNGTLRSTDNASFATGNTISFINIGGSSSTLSQLNLVTTSAASEVGIINASNTLRLRVDSTDTKSIFLNNSGEVAFTAYGSGTVTGTAAYNLSIDSSGNIIETPVAAAANASITIGDSTIALGGTDTTLTGLTDIDLTTASHTIFDNVGANNLTIGAGTTTVIIPGDLQVTGTVTTNNVETVSTSNGVIFEGNVADANELTLLAGTLTADRTVTLPDATGTVALTSDISDDTITITAGNGLVTGGTFTLNGTATTITIDHEDTSSQASVNNSGQTVIQDVTLDDYGHVTALTSVDLSSAFDTAGKITKKISGDGLTTDFTVTHSFGTPIVSVQVLDYGDNGTGATYEVVYTDIERSDDNNITVGFATAPSGTEDYLVLISKFPAIS